jgi:hypothetical protein
MRIYILRYMNNICCCTRPGLPIHYTYMYVCCMIGNVKERRVNVNWGSNINSQSKWKFDRTRSCIFFSIVFFSSKRLTVYNRIFSEACGYKIGRETISFCFFFPSLYKRKEEKKNVSLLACTKHEKYS